MDFKARSGYGISHFGHLNSHSQVMAGSISVSYLSGAVKTPEEILFLVCF